MFWIWGPDAFMIMSAGTKTLEIFLHGNDFAYGSLTNVGSELTVPKVAW